MKSNSMIFEGSPERLDVFITRSETGLSREFVKRLITEGLARVNGKPRKPSFLLGPGDSVEIFLPEREGQKKEPAGLDAILLHEDKALLAVNKPSGLPVHPNDSNWERRPETCLLSEPTLVSLLLKARPELGDGALPRLGLVHRLDRDTSGIMLIAKTPEAQTALQDQFRERLVEKTYVGAVGGVPEKKTGSIDAPIGRASGFKKIKVWEYGREAQTDFKVRETTAKHALLEVYPRTGRTNQIRIHLEFAGHPIVGDRLYGGEKAARLLLHSLRIVFTHPSTGAARTLETGLPDDFRSEWERIKKEDRRAGGR
ncbi:MAG TPA: RluA family pseudouridine synthase [Elusimicrobiales bacterium]|nr:RluA family pseudouridine synthase [Elusimicrobiales bacterium]